MTDKKSPLRSVAQSIKQRLIQQALERRSQEKESQPKPKATLSTLTNIPEEYYKFHLNQEYQTLRIIQEFGDRLGVVSPYFRKHDAIAGATTIINGQQLINFSSYNYLGLNGHPEVSQAAVDAINQYGTSASASRLVSGERAIHRELERSLADVYDTDDAVVMVSGYTTNVSVISLLFGAHDLILHDELIHNSAMQGALLSGAQRLSFPHNDWQALDRILHEQRTKFERVLIIIEGIYSMDGDFPDVPQFIEIKNRYRAFLMIDEAHSFGVMGKRGFGIREHFNLAGNDVDIWMGTLSKTLAGCGGYIAGERALIDRIKFQAGGFVYSVGMSPPLAAAALAALRVMQREPERVEMLQKNSMLFLEQARSRNINIGKATGLAVIPAITGNSLKAMHISAALLASGINVQPIIHPAVPENAARLRFFISSEHSSEQITKTIAVLAEEWDNI